MSSRHRAHVVLLVKFPPQAFIHIGHLLLSFPTTPGKIGLLVGTLQQTKALNTQAIALNKASGAGQTALVQCLAQSIMDIAEGAHGTRYQAAQPGVPRAGRHRGWRWIRPDHARCRRRGPEAMT